MARSIWLGIGYNKRCDCDGYRDTGVSAQFHRLIGVIPTSTKKVHFSQEQWVTACAAREYILRRNERKPIEMKNLNHIRRISHGLSLLIVILFLAGCVLPTEPSGTELPGSTVPAPTPASGAATATPGKHPPRWKTQVGSWPLLGR